MRCDLHVHTRHSGMCNLPVLKRVCRECYNDPEAVYETLKRRGMDLVTVTDHDSIDAVESLRRRPDFFLSEEVTCITPSGMEIHVGALGIKDRDHIELQRRRNDVQSLAAYLGEQSIFFSINHVFSSLTGRRSELDFELFADLFPGIETLNGQIPTGNNAAAARLARAWRKSEIAGSDSHTLASLGLTYTEIPGATDAQTFLEGVRRGQTRVHGASGGYWRLTRAIFEIGLGLMGEKPWTAAFAPLMLAIPMITLGNQASELLFEHRWSRRMWPAALGERLIRS
ncbi:MAG TPA: PHP-associated domain-containing protein [Bryobacteraceae bacterium]|nr:PHP-associated domain-containing protein [Bryobacteraceae bacterium]